jgi:hypothetical protein
MIHYYLNTGHTCELPIRELTDDEFKYLQPFCAAGKHEIKEGYSIDVTVDGTSLFAILFCDERPCRAFAIAGDDEAADLSWMTIERLYYSTVGLPLIHPVEYPFHRPTKTPWIAAIILMLEIEEASWMADFERRLTQAWMRIKQV